MSAPDHLLQTYSTVPPLHMILRKPWPYIHLLKALFSTVSLTEMTWQKWNARMSTEVSLSAFFFRVILVAHGGSQARGRIGATTASLHHSHSNTGSLTHWVRPGIKPVSSWMLVRFVNHWATTGTPERVFYSFINPFQKNFICLCASCFLLPSHPG